MKVRPKSRKTVDPVVIFVSYLVTGPSIVVNAAAMRPVRLLLPDVVEAQTAVKTRSCDTEHGRGDTRSHTEKELLDRGEDVDTKRDFYLVLLEPEPAAQG
jgi:hypothetical protein